ncbi:MAG: hypothetical protein EON96_22180 [Caulobacteraceae bacterium]|nr:MAG: hypothetical protein EON96_22180 [Caulobacteraceae bacterium]
MLRGVASDYTITFVTGSTWTITDNVAGRDGVDTLSNIERLSFSDGTFRVLTPLPMNPPPAPALADEEAWVLPALVDDGSVLKDVDAPLVQPGLADSDEFLIKTFETGPQVQPGVEDVLEFAPAGVIAHGSRSALVTPTDASLHLDDFGLIGGAHGHDDWMFQA